VARKKDSYGYKEYQVSMQWDSYDGSPFVETHTAWPYAQSIEEARSKVTAEFGHNRGFTINCIN
jgi:hypothetical protein